MEKSKRLLVGQPLRAADDGFREARGHDFSSLRDLGENREGQPLDLWFEAANPVAQRLGQHGNHAVGEIHAVASRLRLTVQSGLGLHIVRHIRNVDANQPTRRRGFDIDRVVEILRVVGIDGENKMLAQILAPRGFLRIDLRCHALGLASHLVGKFHGQTVLANDREHVHSGLAGRPEHLDQMPLGIHMGVLPRIELRHDLVADFRIQRRLGRQNIEVACEPRIIRHDIEKLRRPLERSDDSVICPRENPDDTTLAAGRGIIPRPTPLLTGNHTRHDTVSIHRGGGVLRPDKQIRTAEFLIQHMRPAIEVKLNHACEKIGFFRNDVAVLADAGDFAGQLQLLQKTKQTPLPRRRQI